MYKITNVKKNSNIVVNNKTLKYGDSMVVDEVTLEKIETLITGGMISIENRKVRRVEVPQVKVNSFENLATKEDLIEIFFKFHTNVQLDSVELKKLVWFYKNVSPISLLPNHIISDLDEVRDNEELIEILINHIYPELINQFLNR